MNAPSARWRLDPARALPAEPGVRAIARTILDSTQTLPILSMHGHVGAELLADDDPFPDPASLFITPDHYLTRMLVSQGIPIGDTGAGHADEPRSEAEARRLWRLLFDNWRLFRGTPTRLWLEHVFVEVFGLPAPPSRETADDAFDHLTEQLSRPDYRPRALFDRFGIELLATTDAAHSRLEGHARLAADGWRERVIPTFRPDPLLEAGVAGWTAQTDLLAAAADVDVSGYDGFIDAIRRQRRLFVEHGGRATDHSHATAYAERLSHAEASRLYREARSAPLPAAAAEAFRAHMLFELAAMSVEDGLVMQLHHGVLRDHDRGLAADVGANVGFDIPTGMEFTRSLRPLLEAFGRHPDFRLIVFTIDETVYSRELAPLAGAYPAMRLGAPWWFLDAPEAMRRFREATIETAGLYNTSGFVDDTRAFCSIPARHDLSRRIDAGYLAKLVAEHRLTEQEAVDAAIDLAYRLPLASYPPIPTSEKP